MKVYYINVHRDILFMPFFLSDDILTIQPLDPKKRMSENNQSLQTQFVRAERIEENGDEGPKFKQPNKAFYRQRAHCNPLSHNDAFE